MPRAGGGGVVKPVEQTIAAENTWPKEVVYLECGSQLHKALDAAGLLTDKPSQPERNQA